MKETGATTLNGNANNLVQKLTDHTKQFTEKWNDRVNPENRVLGDSCYHFQLDFRNLYDLFDNKIFAA